MNYSELISDVFLIESDQHIDERGVFIESYNKNLFDELNININFVQDNLSVSLKKNTIRGLHYQIAGSRFDIRYRKLLKLTKELRRLYLQHSYS